MAIFDLGLDTLRRRTSMKWTRYAPDVLPLWVAEMDCAVPTGVRGAFEHALQIGDLGYPGYESLPRAFARFAAETWGLDLEQNRIAPCADVMSGIAALIDLITPPGSSVVINPPVYTPFRVAGTTRGRRLIEVPLTDAGRLDLAALDAAFGEHRPAAYLLCNPHNPHGTVHTRAELTEVARLAQTYAVRVISDEIHAPLVGPGVEFVPYVAVQGSENGYVVTAASKAFNLAALKAGLLVAGSGVVDELAGFPYEVRAGASHLGLMVQAAGLDRDRGWLAALVAEVADHKELLADLLRSRLGLSYTPSASTYLAWIDCTPLGIDHPQRQFLDVGRVALNAGQDYGREHSRWVRMNLATSPAIITEAVDRMARALG
jgi:cystathionine beta-lyase